MHLALLLALVAQDTPAGLATDRPGLLLAPTLVPRGRWQFELSTPVWSRSGAGPARTTSWSAPLALRYGLDERVELRATLPAWSELRAADGTRAQGFADAELGLKLALGSDGARPLALVTTLRLPSGDAPFGAAGTGTSLQLVHGRPLGSGGVTWLAGVTHVPLEDVPDPTTATLGALASHPLGGAWSGSVELVLQPGLGHSAGQAYAGCALLAAPHPRLQLDLALDLGLDPDSTDAVASLGFAWSP